MALRKWIEPGAFYSSDGYQNALSAGDVSNTDGGATNRDMTALQSGDTVLVGFYISDDGTFRFLMDRTGGVSDTGFEFIIIGSDPSVELTRTDATFTVNDANTSTWLWAAADTPYGGGPGDPFPVSEYTPVVWHDSETYFQTARLSTNTNTGLFYTQARINGVNTATQLSDTGGDANLEYNMTNLGASAGDIVTLGVYIVDESDVGASGGTTNVYGAANESVIVTQGGYATWSGGISQTPTTGTATTVTGTDIDSSPTSLGSIGFAGIGEIYQRSFAFRVTDTLTYVDIRVDDGENGSNPVNTKKVRLSFSTTLNPPVISSVVSSGEPLPNVTVTVNLSALGSGGTALEYAQSTTNTVPSTGWQTSNQFSQARNTTRYYWASRDRNAAGSFDGPEPAAGLSLAYNNPDTTIDTITGFEIDNSATQFSLPISNGGQYTTYEVRTGSYSGTIVGSIKGNGNLISTDVPADDTQKTYYITAYADADDGGNPSETRSNIQTVLMTATTVTSTYGIQVFNGSGNKVLDTSQVSYTRVTASGTVTLANNASTTITASGCGTGNGHAYVTVPDVDVTSPFELTFPTSDSFTLKNTSGASRTFGYIAFRYK